MNSRHPEQWRPSDAVAVSIILVGLIVTSVMQRFELMPRWGKR